MSGPKRESGLDSGRRLVVRHLGTVPYAEALDLQSEMVRERRAGTVDDHLLLLEHPHVITLGSGSAGDHVLADEAQRRAMGIELFETGRGGDVTYHGPGQLVGYPILDLKPDRKDLHRYLRDLEEVLIRTLTSFDIRGERSEGYTGVWVEGRKIAAIGVRVSSGWITSHGFALNVRTDLSYFDTIVPCGIREREVTSVSHELEREVGPEEVRRPLAEAFGGVFQRKIDVLWATSMASGGEPMR